MSNIFENTNPAMAQAPAGAPATAGVQTVPAGIPTAPAGADKVGQPFNDPFGSQGNQQTAQANAAVFGGMLDNFDVKDIKDEYDNKPAGEYHVAPESLTIRTTKTGKVMATIAYKVIAGDKYVGGYEFRPFFFNTSDKDNVAKNLNALSKAVLEITGGEKDAITQSVLGLMKQFVAGGQEDLKETN